MTEFEELALKKITQDYMIDCIYDQIKGLSGKYGISNAEISNYIGWDSSGFNQKCNRSNDLRITTFIKIFVALTDLITAKEKEMGLDQLGLSDIRITDLITEREMMIGTLFNHISATAEGRAVFLDRKEYVDIFRSMRPFVLVGKRNKRFSDEESDVYIHYYQAAADLG